MDSGDEVASLGYRVIYNIITTHFFVPCFQSTDADARKLMAPDRRDVARIHTDANPVDVGHGHRVRGAVAVPIVRHLVAATGPAGGPPRPGGRRPGVNGPVQGGGGRERRRVSGPAVGHLPADSPVRGVQRQLQQRRRWCVR